MITSEEAVSSYVLAVRESLGNNRRRASADVGRE